LPISVKRVRQLFGYDPETGKCWWKVSISNKIPVGLEAGTDDKGYRRVMVDGKSYYVHVLAWVIVTGDFPKVPIDHRDLDKSNNRWNNLRKSNNSLNTANRSKSVANTSRYKGVGWHFPQGKWRADITVNKRKKFLGCFDTKVLAAAAYAKAAQAIFGEFART